jgi:hypothetical protein
MTAKQRDLPILAVGLALASCAMAPRPQEPAAPPVPPISPNRPTFSDGTALVPHDLVQVETGYTFTKRNRNGVETERHNVPEVTTRYRVLDNLEARVVWNGYAFTQSEASGATDRDEGGTDAAIGVLIPVADQDGWLPTLVFEAITTLGVGSEDLSSGHADPAVKLLWSYGGGHFPDWLGIGGNLVAAYPTEGGDRFTQTAASLYVTANSSPDTCFFAEWYVVVPYANHLDPAHNADVGVIQRLSPDVAVDARVGFGLNDEADDFFSGVGVSFRF